MYLIKSWFIFAASNCSHFLFNFYNRKKWSRVQRVEKDLSFKWHYLEGRKRNWGGCRSLTLIPSQYLQGNWIFIIILFCMCVVIVGDSFLCVYLWRVSVGFSCFGGGGVSGLWFFCLFQGFLWFYLDFFPPEIFLNSTISTHLCFFLPLFPFSIIIYIYCCCDHKSSLHFCTKNY